MAVSAFPVQRSDGQHSFSKKSVRAYNGSYRDYMYIYIYIPKLSTIYFFMVIYNIWLRV